VAVHSGNESTQFSYDGFGRRVGIRELVDGSVVSERRFLWCDDNICEERAPSGAVSKRFFDQGMQLENGPTTGLFFYTRDHLGSVREVIDNAGAVRARYVYDPFGRRTLLKGDLEADFGFAWMLWIPEIDQNSTWFRPYDSTLSRDPLEDAELSEGDNLYVYVRNDPVNRIDPSGRQAHYPGIGPTSPGESIALFMLCVIFHICSGGGYIYRSNAPPPPPPPGDPARCKNVTPINDKVTCCLRELNLLPPLE
jgi:RHS repeat-associated protein